MLEKFTKLPTPLKIVCVANTIVVATSGINVLMLFSESTTQDNVIAGISIFLTILIVVGILEKSRFIRIVTLVFAWTTSIFGSLLFLASFMSFSLDSLWLLYTLCVSILTIWGLSVRASKDYYGYEKKPRPAQPSD